MNNFEMIEGIKKNLFKVGFCDERVLNAMKIVDRGFFYPFNEASYEDLSQFVGECVRKIQPSCVARMLSYLDLKKEDNVLIVCLTEGWVSSLVSYLVNPGRVLSVDIHDELIEVARKNSGKFGLDENLHIENQDFFALVQKFDKIIFSCGILRDDEKKISNWVFEHLNDFGRAVVPFDEGPLIFFEKDGKKNKKIYSDERYCFEPLYR